MFTDSKSLFDLVTKTSYTAEKRLMIDITCISDALKLGDIDNIGHISSEHNPADFFTKLKAGILQEIKHRILHHPVQQWIIIKDSGTKRETKTTEATKEETTEDPTEAATCKRNEATTEYSAEDSNGQTAATALEVATTENGKDAGTASSGTTKVKDEYCEADGAQGTFGDVKEEGSVAKKEKDTFKVQGRNGSVEF